MTDLLTPLLNQHQTLAPFIFMIFRSLSVVVLPLPSFLFDLPGIVFFGPYLGLLYGEIAIMLGAIVAFSLTRKFREPFLRRFLFFKKIQKWENKIPSNKTFWALVTMRLSTDIIFDFMNYGLGLSNVGYGKFFFSTLLGSLPSMAFFYLLGGWSLREGTYYFVAFLVIVITFWIILYKAKSRY